MLFGDCRLTFFRSFRRVQRFARFILKHAISLIIVAAFNSLESMTYDMFHNGSMIANSLGG